MWVLTFSSTVFLILALASLTLAPALFTAEYKKLPRDLAPATALVVTVDDTLLLLLRLCNCVVPLTMHVRNKQMQYVLWNITPSVEPLSFCSVFRLGNNVKPQFFHYESSRLSAEDRDPLYRVVLAPRTCRQHFTIHSAWRRKHNTKGISQIRSWTTHKWQTKNTNTLACQVLQ